MSVQTAAEIREVLAKLALPYGTFALAGSGALVAAGLLNRPIGDLDVFVTHSTWLRVAASSRRPIWTKTYGEAPEPGDPPYLERYDLACPVHVFEDWKQRDFPVSVPELLTQIEWHDGVPTFPVDHVVMHKRYLARKYGTQKHVDDIAFIDRYKTTWDIRVLNLPGWTGRA